MLENKANNDWTIIEFVIRCGQSKILIIGVEQINFINKYKLGYDETIICLHGGSHGVYRQTNPH